jgi:hypothetical protein
VGHEGMKLYPEQQHYNAGPIMGKPLASEKIESSNGTKI